MNWGPACFALVWMFALFHDSDAQQRQGATTYSKVASVGGQQILECNLRYPDNRPLKYIVTWRKDGIKDPILIKYYHYPPQISNQYKDRLALMNEISLIISPIRSEDQGWYECGLTFIDGKTEINGNGTWIYLTVHSPPRIVSSSPPTLQYRRGGSVVLSCEGTGNPEPNLVWHKDGQVLQDSLRTTVTGSDVQILNLQRSDGGTYSCTFTNPVGEVSQLIKLVVEGSPFITISPRNTTAVEGQRIKFFCSAEAFPANITYYWYKDGTSVRDLNVFDKRLTLTPDGGLLLTGVVKDDMGWYTCKPSNSIGHDEASAYLNVTYFPRVITEQMPSQVIWAKNFQQSLDCPVDANPPRTNTIWSKGQTILESKGRLDILLNGTLLVSGVLETDAGSYSCTPVSALGYGQPSPNVQVLVKDPPYFTVRPALLYQKQVDESVVMVCAASGTPSPFIEWKKVEGIIDISSGRISQNGGNLSISRTVKEDHGKYECIASNTIATIIASTELHILNTTPHAPYNVTVVPSYFSADVSWEPAYDGGRPQFYMLWFRQSGGSWNQLTIPVQATSFTVYTLQPNTNYDFMVLSRNDLGNGSFSDVVAARTLDPDHKARPRTTLRTMGYDPSFVTALPIGADGVTYIPDVKESYGPQPTPPRNVTAVRQEDGSILVTWQSPLDPPVPVFWYTVEYRPFGSQIWQRYEGYVLSTAGNRKLMKDLDPGTYQVKVVAYGVMAFSPTSNVATVEIPSNHQSRTIPSNAEPGSDSRLIPEAMIGGIVGGVLFLLVAVLLTTMAIIHSRRKDSKARNAANYVDVNYGKPEEENNIHIQSPSKRDRWQQNGGGDIVTSLANTNSIFFLPDSHKVSDQNSMFRDPRFDDRDFRGRFPDATYQVPKSPPTSSDGQNAYPPNYYKPHSPLTAHDSYPLASNRNYLPDLNTSRVRSHSQPPEHFGSRSLGPDSTDFSYPESKSLPRYPKSFGSLQRPEGKSFGQQPELPLSYLGDKYLQHYPSQSFDGPYQSFQSEDDDVFDQGSHLPSSGPAGLPRHSSMKPASQQTYLVGDELGNTLEDISSVLDTPQEQYFHPSRKDLKTHPWQQPSLDLSKVIPVGSASGDVNLEGHSPTRDKPLARVWPSPKYAEENNVSSDSSGHPLGYTRDQLHTVVDRLRQVPRQWPTPGSQYLDVSDRGNKPSDGPSVRLSNIQRDRDTFVPGHSSLRMTAPYLGSNLDHFIPPPPHAPHFPEDSHSSGIGSRNTSQSTSSSRPRFKPSAASVSSLMTPQELSHSEDSAYFPRDTSTDENYEFDHLPALESDILNDLHHYSRLSGIKPGEQVSDSRNVLQGLYPKPSKKSQYADAAERFEKLREEFQQYRQHNQSSSLTSPSFSRYAENQQPLYPMDSEML